MTLTDESTKRIILKLLHGEDYRAEVITLLNSAFLEYAIDFFKKVIEAKLHNSEINIDWYKKEFIDDEINNKPVDIAIHAGLNKKTITNMFNSGSREIVISASKQNYEALYETLQVLIDGNNELDLTLTLKLNRVSVELNISESLIIINSLAVKRAAFTGGLWSTAGKRVEKPLMIILCKLYGVESQYYYANDQIDEGIDFTRETDFYLIDQEGNQHKCEVKLMGRGNPESADVFYARESKIFVADKLSDTNKAQLNHNNVLWVELRDIDGFQRFKNILEELQIPHSNIDINLNYDQVVNSIFNNDA